MATSTETRAASEAFAKLAEKYPQQFEKLYADALGDVEAEVPEHPEQLLLTDAKGQPLLVNARVKTAAGELGRVQRLSSTYGSVLVKTDDGRARTLVARKLTTVKPRGRASTAA